ncbi:ATG4C protease, partial [Atractosteus spatula]|nr:ATG4C protease [Atractosteus spatula]
MENKEPDEVEKLKTRFMSAWHNVKYSWILKTKTCFSRNSPVFVLGKCYHFKAEEMESSLEGCSSEASESEHVTGNVEAFRKDFTSRVWLTYREEFPAISGTNMSSDCGWGCTLRAGQMMLAQALVLHFLGRDWTWPDALKIEGLDTETWTANAARKLVASFEASLQGEKPLETSPIPQTEKRSEDDSSHVGSIYHRKIISWFGDSPLAQLGVHRLIDHGRTSGKTAGDWYGPAVVAHILRKAVEEATDPELQGITVYVAQDCTVYSADVIDSHQGCAQGLDAEPNTDRKAVIILIPVRLGGEKSNPEYYEFVKGILSLEYCLGIIGGKPKQAYYFVGFQDDSLIYMDPHYCQSFVDVSTSDFPLESYHCPSPKKMPFSKMDPSCTIGFYSRNVQDFERITQEITKVLKPSSKEKYPAFTFVKGHGQDYDFTCSQTLERKELPSGELRRPETSMGDFVLL